MNHLIWKLLRRHINGRQLTGFFLANLVGMTIVLAGLQFYRDIVPLFTSTDSFMKGEYVIATKRISALGGLTGKSTAFNQGEVKDMTQQPFAKEVGAFTPSLFKVTAGLGMQQAGIRLSTDMFFESVPDAFVDVNLKRWAYDSLSHTIPIIIPRSYLNLYNFGFAQSRSLPKLSEGLMSLIQMDITLRGAGRQESFKGAIVGFSNRLNTILVPEEFLSWANRTFAPGKTPQPSRLIIEVANPTDPAIADYFDRHGYEPEGNNLDAGRTTYFLRLTTGIVMAIGLIISLLSFYILMLSIYLLLEKNTVKLENLRLLGCSRTQVALPYCLLTTALNAAVLLLAIGLMTLLRGYYTPLIAQLFPAYESASMWPAIAVGIVLFAAVTAINIVAIRRKIPVKR